MTGNPAYSAAPDTDNPRYVDIIKIKLFGLLPRAATHAL
jgi:hypothetical protein